MFAIISVSILQTIIDRVDLTPDVITLTLDKTGLAQALEIPCPKGMNPVSIMIPIRLQRRGVETKLIIEGPNANNNTPDPGLCRLIAQARHWFDQLASGDAASVRDIAKRDHVNENEIARILPLAFLAPKIVEDILNGRQAGGVSVYRLRRLPSLPMDWEDRAKILNNLS